jgi:hypothetical protein
MDFNTRASIGLVGAWRYPLEIDIFLPQFQLGFEYQVTVLREVEPT